MTNGERWGNDGARALGLDPAAPVGPITRKVAKKTVSSVELRCPECDEIIPAPGGSLFWTVDEMGSANLNKCVCPACHAALRFPRV